MKNLDINNKLAAVIADDQDSDAAAAGLKGFNEARPEIGLIKDGKALLDIASLSYGHHYEGISMWHS